MRIPILLEPNYRASIWAQQTLDGMAREAARRKYEIRPLMDADVRAIDLNALFGARKRMVVVVGTSLSWVPDALSTFTARGVDCVLVSFEPPENAMARGIVRMDYVSAMRALLSYLYGCGRARVALYGFNPNSSADTLKKDYFERWNAVNPHADGRNVFDNRASLAGCYEAFRPHRARFDAVICANDIVAASLLQNLRGDGARVPDDLFVASFGDSALSRRVRPAVTSVSLEHAEMGRLAVHLYAFLYRQEASASVSVRVRSRLIVRASTGETPPEDAAGDLLKPKPRAVPPAYHPIDFYADPDAERLMRVERLLSACDDTDRLILRGLMDGSAAEALAEKLFLSPSALRYRLKRLTAAAGCGARAEFAAFLAFCGALGVEV